MKDYKDNKIYGKIKPKRQQKIYGRILSNQNWG